MTAIAAAFGVLFADPNLAIDALYRAGGEGSGTPVRVMRSSPDETNTWNGGRFVAETTMLDVQIDDAPNLAAGDIFEIAGETFRVQGEPTRDAEHIFWRAEAVAA